MSENLKNTLDAIEITSQSNDFKKIGHVPKELLPIFPNLRTLYIAWSGISEIVASAFTNSTAPNRLTSIKLPNNKLTIIKRNAFATLFSVKDLDLSLNYIHTIEKGAFDDLTKLEHLNLYGNQLRALENHLFDKLMALKELRLGNNQIESIGNCLYALNSIESLRLGHNEKIQDIDFVKIGRLPKLKTLILFHAAVNLTDNVNKIDSMEPLESPLSILDVAFSNLTIDAVFKIFSHFRNLTQINIGGNEIDKENKILKEIGKRTPLRIDFDDFNLY